MKIIIHDINEKELEKIYNLTLEFVSSKINIRV